MRRTINWTVAILLAIVFAVSILDGRFAKQKPQVSRHQILTIFNGLSLGMKQVEVERLAAPYSELTVGKDSSGLLIESPLEFGAKNWVLSTRNDSDGGLVFARIHTADSFNEKPSDAPEDLGSELPNRN